MKSEGYPAPAAENSRGGLSGEPTAALAAAPKVSASPTKASTLSHTLMNSLVDYIRLDKSIGRTGQPGPDRAMAKRRGG